MLKSGVDTLVEDTEKALEKNMAKKAEPETLWGKVKSGGSKAIDFATSSTVGRVISIGSATFTATTGGLVWRLAIAIVTITVQLQA
ncbi:MAG: hypothetical protein MTP17_03080 [Candidatus Midichloria sp.]|nr:MAG: hypothetical protein MTP17_03080 [Candidatus Midichloria sp.]